MASSSGSGLGEDSGRGGRPVRDLPIAMRMGLSRDCLQDRGPAARWRRVWSPSLTWSASAGDRAVRDVVTDRAVGCRPPPGHDSEQHGGHSLLAVVERPSQIRAGLAETIVVIRVSYQFEYRVDIAVNVIRAGPPRRRASGPPGPAPRNS